MSDLSDFKRHVYEPEIEALLQRIIKLRRELEGEREAARFLRGELARAKSEAEALKSEAAA